MQALFRFVRETAELCIFISGYDGGTGEEGGEGIGWLDEQIRH